MTTLSELNSKWWYRLIKVLYIISFVSILVITPIGVFLSYGPQYDNEKSYIKCANGKEFILSENGISLYSDFMWTSDKEKAQSFCTDFDPLKYRATSTSRPSLDSIFGNTDSRMPTFQDKIQPMTSGKYELISKYTNRDWFATIGFSLLSIIATLLFFELMRRIFYYIVLGMIRPK